MKTLFSKKKIIAAGYYFLVKLACERNNTEVMFFSDLSNVFFRFSLRCPETELDGGEGGGGGGRLDAHRHGVFGAEHRHGAG